MLWYQVRLTVGRGQEKQRPQVGSSRESEARAGVAQLCGWVLHLTAQGSGWECWGRSGYCLTFRGWRSRRRAML